MDIKSVCKGIIFLTSVTFASGASFAQGNDDIEELVSRQTEAISNLKIDKITVWDSGNGGKNGEGGSTSNFISSLMQSLPPVHDVAKMAGVELPEYLGAMKDE